MLFNVRKIVTTVEDGTLKIKWESNRERHGWLWRFVMPDDHDSDRVTIKITAPQGGIAIFSDSEDWRGRPVQPGERIMTVANPARIGVTVYVPPQDAVQLSVGGEVTLFLDTAPLSPLKATIVQTSYETTVMPDNSLAYVVKAALPISEGFPRIGLRGTAKVYGEKVSLGYYLLRKPIIFLRKSLGI